MFKKLQRKSSIDLKKGLFIKIIFLFIFSFITTHCFSFDYKQWWENWYNKGGTSGTGNRGLVKEFKVGSINDFLNKYDILSVVEFGCGDGEILQLSNYKNYLGLDVSKAAISMCLSKFKNDSSKSFMLYNPQYFINNTMKNIDLVVCLDVLYHVIDENDYIKVLDDIFSFSSKYVMLYTSLYNYKGSNDGPEIKHRNVLEYLKKYKNYDIQIVKQKYPKLSSADFIFLTNKTKK